MHKNKTFLIAAALLASTVLTTSACTPTVAQRGNMLANYQIEKVIPTVHTRSDVVRLLGSPTTQGTFDDNTWYYIGQETEKKGVLDPKVTDERIVVVKFDDEGIVQSVQDMDTARVDIPIVRGKTQTHGNDITFMQQLLGNLGKFNTEQGGI